MPLVWTEWLPEHIAAEAISEEPQRFAALVEQLHTQWHSDKETKGLAEAAEATLPWVPLVKAFTTARVDPGIEVIRHLVQLLLDIVLSTHADLAAQTRWAQQLHRLLRQYRRRLAVQIPWRPLYRMLQDLFMRPSANYEGAAVVHARREALVRVVHRARRFFPPGSAAELWRELQPALEDAQREDCLEAVGWLCMFLPTHELLRRNGGNGNGGGAIGRGGTDAPGGTSGGWAGWAPLWLSLWETLPQSYFTNALWYHIFARLAKHDVHGRIDWAPLLPSLFTRFMWAFQVPVGAATASSPFDFPAPLNAQVMFSSDVKSRSASVAKAIIYLLGRVPLPPRPSPSGDPPPVATQLGMTAAGGEGQEESGPSGSGGDAVLEHLESTVCLLEQYFHPSNGGRWTNTLSNFMRELSNHLCKRVVGERAGGGGGGSGGAGSDSDDNFSSEDELLDDDDEVDDDDDDMCDDSTVTGAGGRGSPDSSSSGGYLGEDRPLAGAVGGAAQLSRKRQRLERAVMDRVAGALVRLASKGQFAKDKGLTRNSSYVLAAMAHLNPPLVLALAHKQFQTALETVTASHQLSTATQTLSLCVRTMLVAGIPLPTVEGGAAGEDPFQEGESLAERRAAAAAAVAAAMMAMLPGIDANDPPKSLAAFRFFCCVLSSVGELPETPTTVLPLYTEEWAEEVLGRVFTIISNLDAPEHRGGEHSSSDTAAPLDAASFLMGGNSMFRPLMEMLYVRLPPRLRALAIRRTAKFLLENTFVSVSQDAAVLCNAIAWCDPEATGEELLGPLLRMLSADVAAATKSRGQRLSKVEETSLKWRLSLLASTSFHMGPLLLRYRSQIVTVLQGAAAVPSQGVQDASSRAVSSLLLGLCTYYPLEQYNTRTARLALGEGQDVETFLDKRGKGGGGEEEGRGVRWHIPSQEEVEFSNDLIARFLVTPGEELAAWAVAGGAESSPQDGNGAGGREWVRGRLQMMEGALAGCRSCLPDFPGCSPGGEGSLCLAGGAGATVGSAEVRARVAQCLLTAASAIGATDYDGLKGLLRVADGTLSVGAPEYADSTANLGAWGNDEKWMHEPAVAGLLHEQLGMVAEGQLAWRRRWPRWLAAERVFLNLEWRASQAAYRWWPRVGADPSPSLDAVPPLYRQLLSRVVALSLHSYQGVRETADSILERNLKRYPVLVPACTAPLYCALAKLPPPPLANPLGAEGLDFGVTTGLVLEELRAGVRGAAAAAAAATQPEPEAEQALAMGAGTLLRGRAVWRHMCRDWYAMRGFLAAMLASAAHTGSDAQLAVLAANLMFAFRFLRPAVHDPQQASVLVADLLEAAKGGGGALPWRYVVTTNAFLVFFLPSLDARSAAALMTHFAGLLITDLLLARQLAMLGVNSLLIPLYMAQHGQQGADASVASGGTEPAGEAVQAAAKALAATVVGNPEFGGKLFQQLALGHPQLVVGTGAEGGEGGGGRSRLPYMSRDDAVVKTVAATLGRLLDWPAGRETVEPISDGKFVPQHAQLVQVLCTVAPAATLAQLRAPLERALARGVSQDVDRPATSAAAEAVAGMLASGGVFSNGAWEEWVSPLLRHALASAPLDHLELWGSAVLRYAVHALASGGRWGPLASLMDLLLEQVPEGSNSSALVKRLTYLGYAITELSVVTGVKQHTQLLRSLLARLLRELPDTFHHSGDMVRGAAAQLAVLAPALALDMTGDSWQGGTTDSRSVGSSVVMVGRGGEGEDSPGGGSIEAEVELIAEASGPGEGEGSLAGGSGDRPLLLLPITSPKLKQAARSFLDAVVEQFLESVDVMVSVLSGGQGAASLAPAAADVAFPLGVADMEMEELEVGRGGADEEASFLMEGDVVVVSPRSAQRAQQAQRGEAGQEEDRAGGEGDPAYLAAVARISFASQLAIAALSSGAGTALAPWLLRMLGGLLKIQELIPSQLQAVNLEVKKALVFLKYLPLPQPLVGDTLEVVEKAAEGATWAERASALVFLQYFWFRHAFLLGGAGTARVLRLVTARLADDKLEVRELAATTLSGVLKGMSEAAAEQLRGSFLADAVKLFPARNRGRAAPAAAPPQGGPPPPSLPARHAVVLGLKAFVLSTPYDVPPWLPEVLMVLVRLAVEPPPIRTTVTKALAEFRRTHEEAGLAEVKERLTEDHWEAIRDVASPATYFV